MKTIHTIGLMSGTSLDGVDIAYCIFHFSTDENSVLSFDIPYAETFPYPEELIEKLSHPFLLSGVEMAKLDADLGTFYGDLILNFCQKNGIKKVDVVGSHGHTMYHQPDKNFTMQIGSGAHIAARCGFQVISDFRKMDVALGGQGAPLVPIGDAMLFSSFDACLNLGGFANVSFNYNGKRIGYDVTFCNKVLNHYAQKLGKSFDENGEISSFYAVDEDVLHRLSQWEYYQNSPPKSLGEEALLDKIFPIFDGYSAETILATCTHHIAEQIVNESVKYQWRKILCTGGGVKNKFLMELIRSKSKAEWMIPENKLIDFKEAMIFALLAALRKFGKPNVWASVTGAVKDHLGGCIWA